MADVSTQSKAVSSMSQDWELAAALLGGTSKMRAAGEKFLPKWPGEDADSYKCRRDTATLFPAYLRTVETLTGKPFSKPLVINKDVPARIVEWMKDADLQGRNLHSFAADLLETALGYGICGILVDYPRAKGVRTVADEQKAGLRPYLIQIYPENVLGWRSQRVNGKETLKQLRLMECLCEPDGDFGEKEIQQVRVLTPGAWKTYRQNEKKEWIPYEDGVTSIDFIPFIPVYGDRRGFMIAKPPMLEMAHMNVEHWQSASDQQTILHVARVPILTVSGVDDDKFEMKVGASTAVKLPQGGEMKFVEHTGAAIDAGAKSLADLEERMRQAGAELLVIKPGTVTATQVATENAVGMCALQRMVQDLKDALDAALQMMATWVGEKSGGTVTIYNDFAAASLAEASAELLLKTNQAGKLSDETLLGEYKRRGIVASEVNYVDEKERIESQGPALGTIAGPAVKPADNTQAA
jgi:hypothetical protein